MMEVPFGAEVGLLARAGPTREKTTLRLPVEHFDYGEA